MNSSGGAAAIGGGLGTAAAIGGGLCTAAAIDGGLGTATGAPNIPVARDFSDIV